MTTASELQRGHALKQALADAEMRYQADVGAARLRYCDGHDPLDFPAFDAAVKAADRSRAQRIEAAHAEERRAAEEEAAAIHKPPRA